MTKAVAATPLICCIEPVDMISSPAGRFRDQDPQLLK
jgi:hypothetical protein